MKPELRDWIVDTFDVCKAFKIALWDVLRDALESDDPWGKWYAILVTVGLVLIGFSLGRVIFLLIFKVGG